MKTLLLPLLLLIVCAASFAGLYQASITVTTTADSGPGSLRAALAAANDGDTIQFAAALNGQTITLTSAELLINKNLTISGPGPAQLTVRRSTVGGTPNFRIFEISPDHTVTIQGITISNGIAQGTSPANSGGSILNDNSRLTIANSAISGNSARSGGGILSDDTFFLKSTLTVDHCTFTSNSASQNGGAIYNRGSTLAITNSAMSGNSGFAGAGILNDATATGSAQLTISSSTLSGNPATNAGGAIYNVGQGSFVFASIELNDSTISGNSARLGGGIFNDGLNFGNAFLLVTNSTISSNVASVSGGGIYNNGEASSNNAWVSLSNSTLSGNSAGTGGAILINCNKGETTVGIFNCTISDNLANEGGGIYIFGNGKSFFGIGNTILKTGTSGDNIHNAVGQVSTGYNLSNDSGGGVLTAVGDQINTNPLLGPLQDNGGPTFTHALLLGSPALNAGNPSFTPPPDFDQRGTGFPRVFNTRIDIGSFELQALAPIPTPSPTPTASATPTATATATATAAATPTPSATATPTATGTPTATATATATPIGTPTPPPTATPTASPTPTATATPTPSTKLLNISTRLRVLTGDNALIGGFIVTGRAPKRVIIRAIGPSLTNLGIPGALVDPVLELHGPGGFVTITNDNWRDTQETDIKATGIAPSNNLESAIVAMLPPGAYTAIVRGNNSGTGVGLIEAYDLNAAVGSQLANISTRGFVDSGDNVMIGGFILGNGSANARVLLRAIGPSLTNFGIPGALDDPTLELHNNNGDIIAANDDWRETQQVEIKATGIPPSDNRESAIIQPLAPGAYTVIVRGKNNATGVALVEAYRLADP